MNTKEFDVMNKTVNSKVPTLILYNNGSPKAIPINNVRFDGNVTIKDLNNKIENLTKELERQNNNIVKLQNALVSLVGLTKQVAYNGSINTAEINKLCDLKED